MGSRRGFICRMKVGSLQTGGDMAAAQGLHRLKQRNSLGPPARDGQSYAVVHCTGYIKNWPPTGEFGMGLSTLFHCSYRHIFLKSFIYLFILCFIYFFILFFSLISPLSTCTCTLFYIYCLIYRHTCILICIFFCFEFYHCNAACS